MKTGKDLINIESVEYEYKLIKRLSVKNPKILVKFHLFVKSKLFEVLKISTILTFFLVTLLIFLLHLIKLIIIYKFESWFISFDKLLSKLTKISSLIYVVTITYLVSNKFLKCVTLKVVEDF